jgi:sugar phosphate isomerase/epimerase
MVERPHHSGLTRDARFHSVVGIMKMNRRSFLASVPALSAALAAAARLPANQNVKWALSSALWSHYLLCPFADILDVMKETGFMGIRLAGFPRVLQQYGLSAAEIRREVSKRSLHVVTISWGGPLSDPAQRPQVLESARTAMQFLADFGANHLVVFSPDRTRPGANTPAAFRELCDRCNQIGQLAGGMGFTAGLHNHLGQMVQNQDEVDRFMAKTDPKLFGLSPDTAHLHLAGCDVVATLDRYKHRVHFLDYKDAKWTTPAKDWVLPNGQVLPKDSVEARFYASIYDLGDGEVDFPGCHGVLKSVHYRGWICVDLDTARNGPLASYQRCGEYTVSKLQPIYL